MLRTAFLAIGLIIAASAAQATQQGIVTFSKWKAADLCASEPEQVARRLVDGGFTPRFDYALQTLNENPYGNWREYDAEDSMRFYALRLHELGMIKKTPQRIIAEGTDWRPLNELKRELKA